MDTPDSTILTHTLNPTSSAGDYLSIVSFVSFENPGGATNKAWITYPSGAEAPDFNVENAWGIARDARQTYVSMREETLPAGPQNLTVMCDGSLTNSTILWAKAASFRMDAFEADYHDEDLTEVTGVVSSTWATHSTVTQAAPAASSEFLMLGTISGCDLGTVSGPQHGMRFREDSTVQGDSVWGITRECLYAEAFHNTLQWVEPYTTASSKTWDNQYQSTDNLTEARFAESAIHVLQWDTVPPTPDPMTFASAPNDASTTSISMTSTTGTDGSGPVEYLFTFTACGANGGTGGTSSAWQPSTTYSDSGLQVNQCYGYTVTARDSIANTGTASTKVEAYTAANVPGTPVVSSPTSTSLTVDNAPNSNPAITTFAIAVDDDGDGSVFNVTKYVQADGTIGASAVWQTEATWGAQVVTGLSASTLYRFKVKGGNGDNDETAFSAVATGTTSAPPDLQQLRYRWRNDDGGESGGFDTGTGADGSVTISVAKKIETDILGSNRTGNADGIVTTLSSFGSATGGTTLTVASATGFAAGDEVFLINLQGDSSNNGNVGNYEFLEIQSISTNTFTFTTAIQELYGATTSNLVLTGQKVAVQRVPQWTTVTINSGGKLEVSKWNGSNRGVIVFRATGAVTVNAGGEIKGEGFGYQKGAGGSTGGGTSGESYDGIVGSGGNSGFTGTAGGGSGNNTLLAKGTTANRGGGGGGGGATVDAGAAGAVAHDLTTPGGVTGTQLDITHTISGTNRLVLVAIHQANGFPAITSVVWDPTGVNEALTQYAVIPNASDVRTTLFRRVNPTAKTGTMRMTIASSDQLFAAVSSYTGVDQTTPLGTPATGTGTGAISVPVTAAVGDLVFDASGTKESGGASADPSQTERWNGSQASEPFGFGSTEVAATTSVAMDWTGSTEEWAAIGVAIKPASIGTTDGAGGGAGGGYGGGGGGGAGGGESPAAGGTGGSGGGTGVSAGGGGAYSANGGNAGSAGGGGANGGAAGSGATTGQGGAGADPDEPAGGGGGGGTYGSADLTKLFFGSGGGNGGGHDGPVTSQTGGAGGGIIFIIADSVTVSGNIKNKGKKGGNAGSFEGAGGGGSGGSILIQANSVPWGVRLLMPRVRLVAQQP